MEGDFDMYAHIPAHICANKSSIIDIKNTRYYLVENKTRTIGLVIKTYL